MEATAISEETTGLNFLRPHRRVVAFLFLAPVFYELWWYWQLFAFTRREGFPRARRFWWVLIPIYGWVVLHRQLADLEDASFRAGVPAAPGFSPGTAIWLVVFSWLAGSASGRIDSPWVSLGAFVVSGALIALMGSLVQPTANAYLHDKYPEAPATRMTWGEVTAAVLGVLLFALVILGSLP